MKIHVESHKCQYDLNVKVFFTFALIFKLFTKTMKRAREKNKTNTHTHSRVTIVEIQINSLRFEYLHR